MSDAPAGPPSGPPSGSASGSAAPPPGPPRGPGAPPPGAGPQPVPQPVAQPIPQPVHQPVHQPAAQPVITTEARSGRPPWLPAAVIIGAALLLLVGFLVFSNDDEPSSASRTSAPRVTAASSSTATATTAAPTTVVATTELPTTVATTAAPTTTPGTTIAGIPGEIFLEPRAGVGPDPFTPSIDTSPEFGPPTGGGPLAPTAPFPIPVVPPDAAPGTVMPIPGNAPGLYGGTRSRTTCDKEQLVSFLAENPDKAAAWAAVHQIQPSDIPAFVATLTPVLLRTDTRVTNYGFRDGKAPARQVVLQAGTAVMVDEYGVPRVRCYCGNPLREPQPEPTPTYTGESWEGFDPTAVSVVTPSPEPIDEIVIVDVVDETSFVRPVGGTGGTDAAPTDITATGFVGASSEYPGGEFPAALAIDQGPDARQTSWFSAGPNPDAPNAATVFTWGAAAGATPLITSITIESNRDHPLYPTGFGFGEVRIEVELDDVVLFSETVSLDGTPDPDVTVFPNVRGQVYLYFTGHEAPDCGGFSNLIVTGVP